MRCLMLTGRSTLPFSKNRFGIHPGEIDTKTPVKLRDVIRLKFNLRKHHFNIILYICGTNQYSRQNYIPLKAGRYRDPRERLLSSLTEDMDRRHWHTQQSMRVERLILRSELVFPITLQPQAVARCKMSKGGESKYSKGFL